MTEWKVRQNLFYKLNTEPFDDDLNTKDIVITENVVEDSVRYFTEKDLGWIYPSKSFMVAICYAKWISEEFGGDPLLLLDDEELLFGNDPYFVPYSKDPKTYHQILNIIGWWNFDQTKGFVPDVRVYFEKEFLLSEVHSTLCTSE